MTQRAIAASIVLLVIAGCGPSPLRTPAPSSEASARTASPSPAGPATPYSYPPVGLYPDWRVLNDTDAETRIEIREGEELPVLMVVAPHTWTTLGGVSRGHVDGMPDITAHLLDDACGELDSVQIDGWAATFTIVIAPGGTLSIEKWDLGDDETVFSPPRSTFAPSPWQPRCGVNYTSTSPSPS